MKKKGRKALKKKVKGNQVIFSLVCLVLGFIMAFSYHLTRVENKHKNEAVTGSQYEKTLDLRNQLIALEETNRRLQNEYITKQSKMREIEKELSKEEEGYSSIAAEAEKYRMFLGKMKVKGPGIQVSLQDGEYDPKNENINNYLVHEYHVFKVVNELYISGASAVAINGQRLSSRSYIVCNGPVITVDGKQHPAPFVISAIGDPPVLEQALNMSGGVKDQLVNDNIVFTLEKKDLILMNPILGS
ncbi:DUF881 domain-containing protein [Neobacillus notoginsengisoli]|uniref:DUF881 domain-containing protein n=1 Tax=Neobacillus notoginsengisoli TaxID=1578198 RepID=A0A417YQY1_9BACI|nr:DUF881 domain-containing protein [Neobacillus notoginsengisoli]RHW36494.1 DUF881 domain-containing protein [Neobacillus notoginsengisoli]